MANWTPNEKSSVVTTTTVTVAVEPQTNIKLSASREETDDEVKRRTLSQKTIIHNMVVICFSFFLNVTAFSGMTNLQSSINYKDNVGHTSLTLIFLSPIVSSLLIAASVVNKFGCKLTIIVCLLLTGAFQIASLCSMAETLYVGSAITGMAGGILWSAHGSYVTALGRSYALLGGHSPQSIIGRFFGVFFMSHRLSMTAGSLISSLVFQRPPETNHLPPSVVSRICGSAYCYEDLEADHWFNRSSSAQDFQQETSFIVNNNDTRVGVTSSIYRPSLMQTYSLYGIYIGFVLLSPVLVLKFLKPLDDAKSSSTQTHHMKVHLWSNFRATMRHLFDLKMLLLMPIMFVHGTSFGFITADYGVGFSSCTLGIDSVGYVMATFGATSAVTSVSCGLLLKYTGRQALIFFGAVCCAVTLFGMWKWIPSSDEPEILYLFAGMWGVCTTVWTSQLISFIGLLYDDESAPMAFGCYYTILNSSIGSWFIIGRNMCIYSQLQLIAIALAIGMVGYVIVEVLVHKDRRKITASEEASTSTTEDNSDVVTKRVTRY